MYLYAYAHYQCIAIFMIIHNRTQQITIRLQLICCCCCFQLPLSLILRRRRPKTILLAGVAIDP